MAERIWPGVLIIAIVGIASMIVSPALAQEDDTSPQRLETFEFPSDLVDTSTPGGTLSGGRAVPEVNVLLPAGYDSNPDADYPVLWLLHGANLGSDFVARSSLVALAEDFPGIIVIPDGGVFGMYTDWWNSGERGDPAWATYHLTELMDHIESTYRIRPGREWHSLLGISMGGQGVLRYAALRPGYFGSVAAFSAAMPDIQGPLFQGGFNVILLAGGAPGGIDYPIIWGSPTGQYAEGNSPQALISNLEHTRVFLSSGNGINCPQDPINLEAPEGLILDTVTEATINAQQLLFQLSLESAGVDVTAHSTCGVHTFGVWDRAWVQAEAWGFFGNAAPEADTWTYRTIARSGTMWDLDFHFAEPPSSIVRFDRDGSTLGATGTGRVTLTNVDGCTLAAALPFDVSMDDGWTCPDTEASPPTAPSVSDPASIISEPAPAAATLPATGADSTIGLGLWLALALGVALRVTHGVRPHP